MNRGARAMMAVHSLGETDVQRVARAELLRGKRGGHREQRRGAHDDRAKIRGDYTS